MIYVCVQCVLSQNNYTSAAQQQHNTAAVCQAPAVVPAVTVYARVVGAQQEIELRQHAQVQCNNQSTHRRTLYQASEAYGSSSKTKAVAHTYHHWNGCVPSFRLSTPPGYQVNPIPNGNLVSYMTSVMYNFAAQEWGLGDLVSSDFDPPYRERSPYTYANRAVTAPFREYCILVYGRVCC